MMQSAATLYWGGSVALQGSLRPAMGSLGKPAPRLTLVLARQAASRRSLVAVAKVTSNSQEASLAPAEEREQQQLTRRQQREAEAAVYRASAIAATVLLLSVATLATYSRISWHLRDAGEFPVVDLAATLLLVAGGMVGMEMYARYAHARWHDVPLLWRLHASHHEPRLGPFEKNDLYAIANALPAMGLCLYGFLTDNLVGSMCFGAGLGITLFGISYVFVHDGMVHRRFPVGPLVDMPYFKRITLAHQLHHTDRFGGVPFGLFLGPQELEAVGGKEELDRMVAVAEQNRKEKQQQAA